MRAKPKLGLRIAAGVVMFYFSCAAVQLLMQWFSPLPDAAIPYEGFIRSVYHSKVYVDRGNIVLVQGKSAGVEYGKYIIPTTSSHIPFDEESGFQLLGRSTDYIGAEVYEYWRGKPHGAAGGSRPFQLQWTNLPSGAVGARR